MSVFLWNFVFYFYFIFIFGSEKFLSQKCYVKVSNYVVYNMFFFLKMFWKTIKLKSKKKSMIEKKSSFEVNFWVNLRGSDSLFSKKKNYLFFNLGNESIIGVFRCKSLGKIFENFFNFFHVFLWWKNLLKLFYLNFW